MKDTLQKLLASDGTVELVGDLLAQKLGVEENKAIKAIEEFCYVNPNFRKNDMRVRLDDMIRDLTSTLEFKAFYLGVDFTLDLLGRKGAGEYLPEELKAQNPQ